jgi:beta-lactamase regulating signal transducer with metallopeptidase domain/5-hydroxyisourate hydrolase-like protein (transthyretin family)
MGPAIWRASWQATALALLVVLLLWCLGERLSPQWRFLLWGIVVARLLFVATPVSPWSLFNLVHWNPEAGARPIAQHEPEATFTLVPHSSDATTGPSETNVEPPRIADSAPDYAPDAAVARVSAPTDLPPISPAIAIESTSSSKVRFDAVLVTRILSSIWLAGCVLLGLRLLATAHVLRRRLSACRPVTDAGLLELLETSRRRIGLKRTPALLVTPESVSPCIVGTWHPRIVLPELVVTQSSTARLRHVLAHELAHLVRGDLWTNWLLLTARILHWFNPVAWWTVREMQAQREAACDELAFAVLGEADRSAYAATIVELAASLAPCAIAPGLIGLFSSTGRLKARVERLLRFPSVTPLRAPLAAGLLIGLALSGLTDSMPGAKAQARKEAAPAPPPPSSAKEEPKANTHTIGGRCLNNADRSPLAGISVRLYRVEGRSSPPVEIAKTDTDGDGRYTFTGLEPPRPEGHLDRLNYGVFGFAADRPIGISFFHFRDGKEVVELRMVREKSTLSGKVVDAEGRPVAGATVLPYFVYDRPAPSLLSATTDAEGRFKIDNIGVYKWPDGKPVSTSFTVLHPDHPETRGEANALPANVLVTLPTGCLVTGTVTDKITGQPAAGAMITARRVDEWHESFFPTDAAGRIRLTVPEGRYDFLAEAKERVCVAVTGRECATGKKVELPPLTLIGGGFISGQVVNTATGESVSASESGGPIMLGLFGPSQPAGPVISPIRLAAVDKTGRFTLRAAPGENFPYFVNIRGVRMAWDTRTQPPVVVKEGETTTYNMLITPEVPPEVRLTAARKLVEALSKKPSDRTAQILLEFRKLNHTVDETELWCLLMRELVAVGREAVPQLCAELDRTTEERLLRRLGFALRAIGDARAVPALIRAIPKTLLPSSSDYGLIVADTELTTFMQTHDLDKGKRATYFSLGRPVREIIGALHGLTGKNFDDAEVFSMHLSEDPRRQVLQRRIYGRQAQRWQAWWETNWRTFTNDGAFQKVNLKVTDKPLPPDPAPQALGKTARVSGEVTGAVLSPAIQEGQHAWHLYDLDTGYRPNWPTRIPRDETARDPKQLADWASQNGVDLMCITHRSPDGTETYVLRALGMKVREIDGRDWRNLDKLIAAGTLPEGRPVGELLMHYDTKSQQLVPDANAAFLYITREGNMGVIETTDRVIRTADLSGIAAGSPSPGVGFHKGVRFNLKAIIP